MSVRFAASRIAGRSPVARALSRGALPAAANDCDAPLLTPAVEAALRHFSRHGLNAAAAARVCAIAARESGDDAAFGHWHGICAALDPRMAEWLTGD